MEAEYTLSCDKSSLTVSLTGGRIVELILNTIPVLGTFSRIDGKKGNTHLCVPNFGKEGIDQFNLPNHGPARDGTWQLVKKDRLSLAMQYNMPRTGIYPTTLSIVQKFSVTEHSFSQNVQITNTGGKKAPVNCAIHYYWHAPKGWDDVLLNGKNVSSYIKKDTSIDVEKKTIIQIPGQPSFIMDLSSNMKKVQLWTGRKAFQKTTLYDRDYVCIEPALGTGDYFTLIESMLKPNETKIMEVRLSV
jgi:galactose mutarotase-like enzyme